MKYSLDWETNALANLASIWLTASDRQAVTAAQAAIDNRLGTDPYGDGTPLAEGLYFIEAGPLRALYEISEDDKIVSVVAVNKAP